MAVPGIRRRNDVGGQAEAQRRRNFDEGTGSFASHGSLVGYIEPRGINAGRAAPTLVHPGS